MNAPISRGLLLIFDLFEELGFLKVEMNAPISRGLLRGISGRLVLSQLKCRLK